MELSNYFRKIGIEKTKIILDANQIYSVKHDDLLDIIDELFVKVINSFDPTKMSFSAYAKFILGRRLLAPILDYVSYNNMIQFSLDEMYDSDTPFYEAVEDTSILPISKQMTLDKFHYEISSPRASETRNQKQRRRISLLRLAGYSHAEIGKILRISEGKYRSLVRMTTQDDELLKMKLELK